MDDVNARGPYGGTALLAAVEADDLDEARRLLEAGADPTLGENISAKLADYRPSGLKARALHWLGNRMIAKLPGLDDMPDTIITPAYAAYSPGMARLLAEHGAPISEFEQDMVPAAIGADQIAPTNISPDMFNAQYRPRPGQANPERVDIPFWREQIRTGKSGWAAMKDIVGDRKNDVCGGDPVWSFQRFGRSATRLDDGRWVLVAGEHEDHYDPDFCIYADVTVIHADGELEHFIYPADMFPPTDFQTATRVDDTLFLIGSLGYPHMRSEAVTQVLVLDLNTFAISRPDTRGVQPGWINRHHARLVDRRIEIWGGKVEPGYVDNPDRFALDLDSLTWAQL